MTSDRRTDPRADGPTGTRITTGPLTDRAGASLPEGFARQALTLSLRVLDLASVFKRPNDMCQALAQVARAMKAMNAFGPAEGYLAQALHWSSLLPGIDTRVDLLCELAEVCCAAAEAEQAANEHQRHAGRRERERARDHAFEAASLAGQTTDAHWEVKVLLRVSDVLDRCGDHEDAASMQNRAISLMGLAPEGEEAPRDRLHELPLAPGSTLLM